MSASDLFQAYYTLQNEEDQLETILIDKFPWWVVDNYFFDPYDSSIEFKFVPESWAPTQDQLTALHNYGFQKLYVNYEDGATASLYSLPSGDKQRVNNNAGKGNVLS